MSLSNPEPSSSSSVLSRIRNPLQRAQNAILGGFRRSAAGGAANASAPRNALAAKRQRREADYQRRRPASIRTIERRPLTPSLNPEEGNLHQCHRQEQSAFFSKLPPEIRRMIYEDVLGKNVLHILLQTGRLSHICCYEPGKVDWWRHTCLGPAWEEDGTFVGRTEDGSGIADGDKLPLLQTCRLIYSEAIDLMYSANTFDIQDLDRLLDLARTTLPQRMQTIGSLQLRYFHSSVSQARAEDFTSWDNAIQIMASMKSLKRLRIEISTEKMYPTVPRVPVYLRERRLLQPLAAVLGFVKDFQVETNWPAGEGDDAVAEEELPFKLVRPRGAIDFTANGLYRL